MSDPIMSQQKSWVDPSKRAGDILDTILESEVSSENESNQHGHSVEIEKSGERILSTDSGRDAVRVLFVTHDTSFLAEGSHVKKQYLDLCSVFSEVHVLVLSLRTESRNKVVRVGDRMWVYATCSKYWWGRMFDAKRIASEQLMFGGGFRPDIVVALDPFESGVAGLWISEAYKRPFQVHVNSDFTDPYFAKQESRNTWRKRMARFVLKRTFSIRAGEQSIFDMVKAKYKKTAVGILPQYFDLHSFKDSVPSFSLKERYPQFSFIILTIGDLKESTHVRTVIDASMQVLLGHPTVGLVVVGNGPRRSYLEERTKKMGIKDQVIFEPWSDSLISHMKTADLYLNTGIDDESVKRIIKVSAAGLPFISVATEALSVLYEGETAGYLCSDNDAMCFRQHILHFLNHNALRIECGNNAKTIVHERLEQDYSAYLKRYRDTVENVLVEDI